jgi:hypothetical protein
MSASLNTPTKVLSVYIYIYIYEPIPVAARSKESVCARSLTGIAGSNPTRGHGCLSLGSVVCCQLEVSASG